MAGFECGLVHHDRHDLLITTGRIADRRLAEHYHIASEHGLRTIRDGLVPGYRALDRIVAARQAGVEAIWDLSHYHRNQDPARGARITAQAAITVNGGDKLWLCPVNEPSLYPMIAGMPRHDAVEMAASWLGPPATTIPMSAF